ncbi:MAG TPA: TetR/AcrR family transcriptional regulator [Actinomycetota bacterium]|nr:TetR/AcrR family transcriptional regulator [Actinomycetota bacterium]
MAKASGKKTAAKPAPGGRDNGSTTARTRNEGEVRVLGEQGERTRQRLLDAAKKVFRERTYPETRVDDITQEAGTSHGAFYLYFSNKAEVLEALAIGTAERMYVLADQLEGIERGEAGFEQLRRWMESFIDNYEENSPVVVAWMSARPQDERFDKLGREVLAKFAGRIAQAIRHSTSRTDRHAVHPGIAAVSLVAMLERFCYYWLVRGGEFRRQEVTETLAAIWHQSIFGASHRD